MENGCFHAHILVVRFVCLRMRMVVRMRVGTWMVVVMFWFFVFFLLFALGRILMFLDVLLLSLVVLYGNKRFFIADKGFF